MKKLIILAVFSCLMTSLVFATDLQINSVRAYVNDVRDTGADSLGGDVSDVRPSDVVEFRIDITNSNAAVNLNDILVYGVIYRINNGDDYRIDLARFNLRPGDTERKILTFTVPSYADDDSYDVRLFVRGINAADSSESLYNVSYVMDVNSQQDQSYDFRGAIANVTDKIAALDVKTQYVKDKIDIVAGDNGAYAQCKQNITNTEAQVAARVSQLADVTAELNQKNTDISELRAQYDLCNSDKIVISANASRSASDYEQCKKSASNFQWMIMIFALGGAGVYFFYKNRDRFKFKNLPSNTPEGTVLQEKIGRGG